MESQIKGHRKRVEGGYRELAAAVTDSGLNGSCYRMLVGVSLRKSHPQDPSVSSMILREFAAPRQCSPYEEY